MKNFKEFVAEALLEDIENIDLDEDDGASDDATTTTSGVANPDPQPRTFVKSKFMEHDCIDVDPDTYESCIQGKKPFSRWAKFIEDEDLRNEVRKMFKNRKRVLMRDSKNGHMAFVK